MLADTWAVVLHFLVAIKCDIAKRRLHGWCGGAKPVGMLPHQQQNWSQGNLSMI